MHARNLRVQAFKKGPDYIDPLWLSAASDNPCHNLDFNTMTHSEILQTLKYYGATADFRLIEANKGLYDGIALDGSDSNAALAKLTDSAVILVLDTRGMTRGIAPLLMGYQAFDHDVNIAGVILNRTGGDRHVGKLQRAVEEYTDVTVLGAVRNDPEMVIEERHLGLMPSNESDEAERRIVQIRNLVADQVDLDKVF
ncbi:MAG: AAA family ATPase, partial [Thiolinea sp.]